MGVTTNCEWDGTPCECREFHGGMGSETYVYLSDGKVLGAEIIDGEWTVLDAEDARELYEHLTKED